MEFIKVRKKPVEVEAFILTQEIWNDMFDESTTRRGCRGMGISTLRIGINTITIDTRVGVKRDHIVIETLEGAMKATIGDWIVRGVVGELHAVRADIFKQTYEVI